MQVIHKARAFFGKAACTCGWKSNRKTVDIKKAWRAHVRRAA